MGLLKPAPAISLVQVQVDKGSVLAAIWRDYIQHKSPVQALPPKWLPHSSLPVDLPGSVVFCSPLLLHMVAGTTYGSTFVMAVTSILQSEH